MVRPLRLTCEIGRQELSLSSDTHWSSRGKPAIRTVGRLMRASALKTMADLVRGVCEIRGTPAPRLLSMGWTSRSLKTAGVAAQAHKHHVDKVARLLASHRHDVALMTIVELAVAMDEIEQALLEAREPGTTIDWERRYRDLMGY